MLKIRHIPIILGMLFYPLLSSAQGSVSIGINVPLYPEMEVVPGYPVYYAPRMDANFFFYDGMYWVYQDDNWYQSSWYNGPWWSVEPEFVPLFVLRIPVSYYRQPPTFFFGWQSDAPPRWGDHWGRDWQQHRNGWDQWNRSRVHTPAPLPKYQQQYTGEHYPRKLEQQHELQEKSYRYHPRDPVVRQEAQEHTGQKSPVEQNRSQPVQQQQNGTKQPQIQRIQPLPQDTKTTAHPLQQGAHEMPSSKSMEMQRPITRERAVSDKPVQPSPQRQMQEIQRSAPVSPQQNRSQGQTPSQQKSAQHEQPPPKSQGNENRQQGNDGTPQQKREQDQGKDRERNH